VNIEEHLYEEKLECNNDE